MFTDEGTPVACFHISVRSLHLLPGLDVPCSIEGDFAIRSELRGVGLPQQAYLYAAPRLADRSVVLRAGFSSPELYNRVYKRKFGHRMIPTVTTQYRKILSDRALRGKLQEFGDKLRSRPSWQRMLKHRAATIRIDVAGFQPCSLVLTHDASHCTGDLLPRPDLRLRMPYRVLAAPRMRPLRHCSRSPAHSSPGRCGSRIVAHPRAMEPRAAVSARPRSARCHQRDCRRRPSLDDPSDRSPLLFRKPTVFSVCENTTMVEGDVDAVSNNAGR